MSNSKQTSTPPTPATLTPEVVAQVLEQLRTVFHGSEVELDSAHLQMGVVAAEAARGALERTEGDRWRVIDAMREFVLTAADARRVDVSAPSTVLATVRAGVIELRDACAQERATDYCHSLADGADPITKAMAEVAYLACWSHLPSHPRDGWSFGHAVGCSSMRIAQLLAEGLGEGAAHELVATLRALGQDRRAA